MGSLSAPALRVKHIAGTLVWNLTDTPDALTVDMPTSSGSEDAGACTVPMVNQKKGHRTMPASASDDSLTAILIGAGVMMIVGPAVFWARVVSWPIAFLLPLRRTHW